MGIDLVLWRQRIGCFSHRLSYTGSKQRCCLSRLADPSSTLGLCYTLASFSIVALLLLASGIEPNPGPIEVSAAAGESCSLCHGNAVSKETFTCTECSNIVHLSCIVRAFKTKEGSSLKNSINWLHELLLFGNFRYMCSDCIKSVPLYKDTSTSPIHEHQTDDDIVPLTEFIEASTNTNTDLIRWNNVSEDIKSETSNTTDMLCSDNVSGNIISKSSGISDIFRSDISGDTEMLNKSDRDIQSSDCWTSGIELKIESISSALDTISSKVSNLNSCIETTVTAPSESRENYHRSVSVKSRAVSISRSMTFYNSKFRKSRVTSRPVNRDKTEVYAGTNNLKKQPLDLRAAKSCSSNINQASNVGQGENIASNELNINNLSSRIGSSVSASDAMVHSSSSALPISTTENSINDKLNIGCHRKSAALLRACKDGLRPIDVLGDGACLFRAICISDMGSDINHAQLRAAAVDYMRDNSEVFLDYCVLDPDEKLSFDDYLIKISNPIQQVGEFVLNAISNILLKEIRVYYGDCPPRTYTPSYIVDPSVTEVKHIHILFSDLLASNNGHYSALVSRESSVPPVSVQSSIDTQRIDVSAPNGGSSPKRPNDHLNA